MYKLLGLFVFSALTIQSAIACPSYNGISFCSGDRVLTSDNNTGTIVEVFHNGKAVVDYDGFGEDYVWNISELGKGLSCVQRFCRNNRVLTSDNNTGTIIEVFSNGKAVVDYDGFGEDYVWNLSELGRGFRCSGELCVNERVLTPDNNTGYALEIFDNGRVLVDYDGYGQDYVWSIHSLGYELDCYN